MSRLLPNVSEDMLQSEFWLDRLVDQSVPQEFWNREECNLVIRKHSAALVDLVEIGKKLLVDWKPNELKPFLAKRSVDSRTLYDQFGNTLDDEFWNVVTNNAYFSEEDIKVRFGFAVRRASMRQWPTKTNAFRTSTDREFDQFQDTALHTFEPVIVLAESKDCLWYYAISQTYTGWVLQEDVALASWEDFQYYANPKRFVVITKPNVMTQANPYDEMVSKRWIEMAAYLPIVEHVPESIGGQSCVGNIAVEYPIRNSNGWLEVHTALLSSYFGVHEGFLPFSNRSVIQAAFELLTERYGWGDSFGNHDCSSLVMDVFRTVGIQLPRNSDSQEHCFPHRVVFPDTASAAERAGILANIQPGAPLYMPGHTMIYLGEMNERHYIIHDFAGYVQYADGSYISVPINEVMISTLDILSSQGQMYLEALTGALNLFVRP